MSDELSYENIVPQLTARFPQLRELYRDHLKDYDELLPHVFFGDLTRYLVSAFARPADSAERRSAAALVTLLEQAMSSRDEALKDLLSVSLLENMERADPGYSAMRAALGPKLLEQLQKYEK